MTSSRPQSPRPRRQLPLPLHTTAPLLLQHNTASKSHEHRPTTWCLHSITSTTCSRRNARPSSSRRRRARWCTTFGSRVLLEHRRRDTVRVCVVCGEVGMRVLLRLMAAAQIPTDRPLRLPRHDTTTTSRSSHSLSSYSYTAALRANSYPLCKSSSRQRE